MSISTEINYDNELNFTFDTDVIEISEDAAQLKLLYTSISDYSEDFADNTGFTYDNTKAEFVAGSLQKKDQRPAGATFGHKFTTKDGNWGDGSLTCTLAGSATITAGKLVCTTPSDGLLIPGTGNAAFTTTGCIRFKYTPNYTGSPGADLYMFSTTAGPNEMYLRHLTANTLHFTAKNSSGATSIFTASFGSWSPTSGQEYEIELNFDFTAGSTRIFIDGVQRGATVNTTLARGVSANFYLGYYNTGVGSLNASYDDLEIFNTVQHTLNYTPGYTVPTTLYAESVTVLPTFTYTGPGLLRPAGPPSSTETGTPRYIIQGKYWDGSTWSTSNDTYAQATSKADIVTNIATFPSTGASTIIVKVAFGASSTQSSVDQIDFSVQGQLYPTDSPSILVNSGIRSDELVSFSTIETVAGSDSVTFAINVSGTDKYWDGSEWSTSTSATQSNTEAEVLTNISSLDLSAGHTIKIKAYLNSVDGLTTPSITSVSLSYDFAAPILSEPNECVVYSTVRTLVGDPHATAVKLRVTNESVFYYNNDTIVPPNVQTITADSSGRFDVSLIETASNTTVYKFELLYLDSLGKQKTVLLGNATIPNQTTVNIASLTFS